MDTTNEPASARDAAIAHCAYFCDRLLPGAVRRVSTWKGLPRRLRHELREEAAQELAVDAIAHADEVAAMAPHARHLRWLRLVDRFVYKHYVVPRRCAPAGRRAHELEQARCRAPEPWLHAPDVPLAIARLGNGRCNVVRTARTARVPVRSVQRVLAHVADACGFDPAQRAFWRERLAEGLVGLAADLLRAEGRVHLLARARPAPDVAARQARLRRIGDRLPALKATNDERRVARAWSRRQTFDAGAPLRALADATALAPANAAAWCWRFEAAIAAGDAHEAAASLRAARQSDGLPRATAALARARLREARGDRPGAVRALLRALRRAPHDATLRAAATAAALAVGNP